MGCRQRSRKAGKGRWSRVLSSMFKEAVWNGPSSIMFKKDWDTSETGLCCRCCSKKKAGTPGRMNGELLFKEGWNGGSLERGGSSSTVRGKWDSKIIKLSHVVMGLKKIRISPQ
jgi:hypothetical protein